MEDNSKIIIIRSVYKITRAFMEPSKHPISDRYAPCVRKVDSNGDRILSEKDKLNMDNLIGENEVIEIYDGKSFNLEDPYDAAWWEAIKDSPKIAKDRWAKDKTGKLVIDGDTKRYGSAEFYIERPGAETRGKNVKNREKHEAKAFIYNDSPDELYKRVKLLGNPMTGLPISDVEDYLVSIAERDPQKIKELYTGTDTHLRMLLIDALDQRVITFKDKLYIYGEDIILGATKDFVIHWMKDPKNKKLVDGIKRETYADVYETDYIEELEDPIQDPVLPKTTVVAKKTATK